MLKALVGVESLFVIIQCKTETACPVAVSLTANDIHGEPKVFLL